MCTPPSYHLYSNPVEGEERGGVRKGQSKMVEKKKKEEEEEQREEEREKREEKGRGRSG